ncbi:nuclear transport factor 2 family protein [Pseudorhodoplanes sp.]|uniref:nuclear transport factor 2 family protein n=1 Tax=Pseudorhodoplanes sp. TaxID=1934341 RepID=UPI00391A3AD2
MTGPEGMEALARTPPWVRAFYDAYLSGDALRLEAVLHDEVTWLISGPADWVDLFGARRGKPEVIELVTRIIPCYQRLTGFEFEHVLVDGDHAAMAGRLCAFQRETMRAIRVAFAHFLQFQGGKLIAMRAVCDSFDALEQITGCRIALVTEPGRVQGNADDTVIPV